MRTSALVVAAGLALGLAAGRVSANPVGVPPNAIAVPVEDGHEVRIDLGSPQTHGWYVKVWGSYKVGDTEYKANGSAKDGVNDPKSGCVFITSTDGGACFYPSEDQGNKSHEFLKSVHGAGPFTLVIEPPAGAQGAFYYRLENAP